MTTNKRTKKGIKEMTCRERLANEKPEMVNAQHIGGCFSCPHEYGYLDKPEYCSFANCYKCWDREIPSTEDMAVKADDRPHILDSGERRQFDTGAVRDIQEGKGRCDLLPLYVVGAYYKTISDGEKENIYWVFHNINRFRETNNVEHLYRALQRFDSFGNDETMFLEVAKHFEEGCKKYGENNWQKGIPTHCYIDSAVRHYLKWARGDKDEPHDRAFVWNILCCIWTCIHKPELNDYAGKDGDHDAE